MLYTRGGQADPAKEPQRKPLNFQESPGRGKAEEEGKGGEAKNNGSILVLVRFSSGSTPWSLEVQARNTRANISVAVVAAS